SALPPAPHLSAPTPAVQPDRHCLLFSRPERRRRVPHPSKIEKGGAASVGLMRAMQKGGPASRGRAPQQSRSRPTGASDLHIVAFSRKLQRAPFHAFAGASEHGVLRLRVFFRGERARYAQDDSAGAAGACSLFPAKAAHPAPNIKMIMFFS